MEIVMRNEKGQELVTDMFRSLFFIFYFVVHHLTMFDALIQRSFNFDKLQLVLYTSHFMMS